MAQTEEAVHERQQLVSELFHALSQPITALRCSLELALQDGGTAISSPQNLETALGHAEQIAQLATGIRELIAADDPGDERCELGLESYLQDAVLDMQPLAEAAQVKLQRNGDAHYRITAEPHRLRQALFYLLEFGLASSAAGSVLQIHVEPQACEVMTTLTMVREPASIVSLGASASDAEQKSLELSRRLGLAIASRIFETAGGLLQVQEDEQHLRVRLRLPRSG